MLKRTRSGFGAGRASSAKCVVLERRGVASRVGHQLEVFDVEPSATGRRVVIEFDARDRDLSDEIETAAVSTPIWPETPRTLLPNGHYRYHRVIVRMNGGTTAFVSGLG